MGKSSIEWTDATWNPIVGCSIVSPGCTNCYAMRQAWRFKASYLGRKVAGPPAENVVRKVNGNAVWTGQLAVAPDYALLAPLHRKKPTMYFVNSMGDLFHEDCPDEWIDKVFAVMALAPQHTFQVLTKRAGRMRKYFERYRGQDDHNCADMIADAAAALLGRSGARGADRYNGQSPGWPLPNVWLGVSTERQQEADERIPLLLQTPAAVRFISAEPLLGPISLRWAKWDDWKGRTDIDHLDGARMLDWVIVGGESGPKARPMHPDWARELRDQCHEAGVAFHFKQWGEFAPQFDESGSQHSAALPASRIHSFPRGDHLATSMVRVGKKKAGRLLDGREHNEFPTARAL